MIDIATIDLGQLPSLPLTDLDGLPETSAIYFAISKAKKVLYIGRATSLAQRWRVHHRREQLARLGDVSIAWLETNDDSLSRLERELIDRFQPTLNWTRPEAVKDSATVAFRLPETVITHYQKLANQERRKLSEVLRNVLTDHATQCCADLLGESS